MSVGVPAHLLALPAKCTRWAGTPTLLAGKGHAVRSLFTGVTKERGIAHYGTGESAAICCKLHVPSAAALRAEVPARLRMLQAAEVGR